ncbi:MAG: site-2 protease family protein [Planctomycetaceae bacterium]|nr:site-2 protease family protein [Planctomycetaceae bacterium]
MSVSKNPLFWSFPAGSLFATRIRISIYFPLLLISPSVRLDFQIALALTIIFLVSTLLHELIGHVLVARSTGGDANEVLLWPLGGLAWVRPANTFQSQFLTAAGGPGMNLLICLATLPTVLFVENGSAAFYPFHLPVTQFSEQWSGEVFLLIFFVNWTLALINLLPVHPLDGGRMLEACLRGHGSETERKTLCLRISMITGIMLMILGIYLDNVWVVVFSSMLMMLSILESANQHWGDSYDESFMDTISQKVTHLWSEASKQKSTHNKVTGPSDKKRKKPKNRNICKKSNKNKNASLIHCSPKCTSQESIL